MRTLKFLIVGVICLVLALTCLFTIAGYGGESHWVLDLTNHFRRQYFFIQLVGLVLLVIVFFKSANKPVTSVLFALLLLCAGMNYIELKPYLGIEMRIESKNKHTLKLMHVNVFAAGRKPQDLISAIRTGRPDMVDLVEYTEFWEHALEESGVLKDYPYRVHGKAHMALYSKIPLESSSLFYTTPEQPIANAANLLVKFKLGDGNVSLLVGHPPLPILAKNAQLQKKTFEMWARQRHQYGDNLIIVGDLNSTPWSLPFKKLLRESGLKDSQVGFGVQPSWPVFFAPLGMPAYKPNFVPLVGIPIDHVLVSPRVEVLDRKVGPNVWSDHMPVVVELTLKN